MSTPVKRTPAKRILLLAPQPFFTARGTPLNVREILTTLSGNGYQVDCLVYPFGQDLQIQNVSILRSPNMPFVRSVPIGPSIAKIFLDIPFLFKALWLGLTRRYDAFHGIEEAGFFAGILGLLCRKPYIFDVDSSMHDQLETSGFISSKLILRAFTAIETFFIKRSTAVVTVCQALSEEVKRIAPSANVHQIEDFPLDGEDGGHETAAPIDLRRVHHVPADRAMLLYLGNFEPYQGIDLFLEAYADYIQPRIKRDLKINSHLMLVGGGEARLAATKAYSEKLGLAGFVTFAGPVPPEASAAVLRQADVLISPRLAGTNTPLKIYSYMQAGKPIIATDIYSHTQVLDDRSAILSEPTRGGLQAAISAVLDESDEAQERSLQLGRAAKELVETRYSREIFRDGFTKLYRAVLVNG